MYLHIGNGVLVNDSEIVAVFDLDNSSHSNITRDYLSRAEKAGQLITVAEGELPKSFVLCAGKNWKKLYLCNINSSTIFKRSENPLPE